MIRHVPALDGLRGAAVLAVVLFHSDGLLKGGYLGVDLFFVLSGYLITSILVAEHEKNGRIALGRFWVRRARRLLPALLALMPGVALYALVWAKYAELAGIRADALATLGYVANWRAIFTNKSYWDLFIAPSPLEHTWSLAIEEQFYVFFPLLAAAALSRPSRSKTLFRVTLGLGLASAALLAWKYDPGRTARVYLGTDTRASGMLLGAALATRMSPDARLEGSRGRALGFASLVACVLLGIAWAKLDGQDPRLYHGGFFVTELLCLTVLAAAVMRPTSLVARFFSLAPLRAVGNVSYGVYLWHWPVFVVMTPDGVHVGPWALFALRVSLTFAIALVSYRFLETPIRKKGLPFGKPGILVPLAFVASFAPIGAVTWLRKPTAWSGPVDAWSPWPNKYSVGMRTLPPADKLRPGTLRVLTLGDSVASFLGMALRHAQDDREVFVAEHGVGSCSLFEAETRIVDGRRIESTSCSQDWVTDVDTLRPDVSLVVMGGAFLAPKTCEPEFRVAYQKRLGTLLDAMGPRAGKVIITLVPYPVGRWRWGDVPERVLCLNSILTEFSKQRNLPTLDLMGFVCPTKECTLLSKGEPVRPDGLHFDGAGAEETAAFTWREIRRIAAQGRDAGSDAGP
jgi:peptidoglycan/LPS O-acetylase OafA/YrhL